MWYKTIKKGVHRDRAFTIIKRRDFNERRKRVNPEGQGAEEEVLQTTCSTSIATKQSLVDSQH